MTLHTLHLEQPAAEVLACALLRAIDDLEARAVIAEHHDPIIGPLSATEYRSDIERLRLVVDAIVPGICAPAPERAAIPWIDGTWTVTRGRPVRLHRQDDLEGLLESSLDLVDHGLLDPHDTLVAIHYLVIHDRLHLATTSHLIDVTDDHDHDNEPTEAQDQTSTDHATLELQASCLPNPQAAHRVAPGCQPAPAHAAETGARSC